MSVTSIKVSVELRDRLAAVAARDYGGGSLGDALGRLLSEHEGARLRADIVTAYERLRADAPAWDDYVAELAEWDGVAADGLSDPSE